MLRHDQTDVEATQDTPGASHPGGSVRFRPVSTLLRSVSESCSDWLTGAQRLHELSRASLLVRLRSSHVDDGHTLWDWTYGGEGVVGRFSVE
jgi:hypothetical protein